MGLSKGEVYAASFTPEKQTEKFLTAVQKRDSKTIFDMSYYYQMELSQIRSNNPKALWPKLTTEYYDSKKSVLFSKKEESLTDAWVRFGGELFGTPTDPAENIRALGLLLPFARWKVIESKREKQYDSWSGRQHDVYVVYVSLNYETVAVSPLIASKVLKEAILSLFLDAKTGLYIQSSRVGKGDVYWGGDPLIDLRVAQRLYYPGRLYKEAINLLENLRIRNQLDKEGNRFLAMIYFEKVLKDCIDYRLDKAGNWFVFGISEWGCKDGSNLQRDIDTAISLDGEIRMRWVTFLANSSLEHLSKEDFNSIAIEKILIIATKYASGYPGIEQLLYKPKFALASIYISWAKASKLYQAYEEDIKKVISLLPGDESVKRLATEAIKHLINKQVQEGGPYVDSNIREAREFAKSLGLNLEP